MMTMPPRPVQMSSTSRRPTEYRQCCPESPQGKHTCTYTVLVDASKAHEAVLLTKVCLLLAEL